MDVWKCGIVQLKLANAKWCLMFLVLADSIEIMNEEGGGGAMHVVALFLIHT